jgi:hypothetical protein
MQPRIDISRNNRFTIWEGGGWAEKKGFGTGMIIAGHDGNKLQVVFDVNPTQNVHQCCFFAEIGQVVCEAFVKPADQVIDGKNLMVSIELVTIKSLSTRLVQGKAKAKAEFETKWVYRAQARASSAIELAEAYKVDNEFFKPELYNLIKLAIEKALTPPEQQRVFWAIPRAPREEYA